MVCGRDTAYTTAQSWSKVLADCPQTHWLKAQTLPLIRLSISCGTMAQNNRTSRDWSRTVIDSTLHSLAAERCVVCLGADMKDLPLCFIQSERMWPWNDWKPITAAFVSVRRWNQIFLEFEMWVSSLSVTSTHTLPLYYTYITPQSCIWQKWQSPWQPNTASCTEGSCCMAHCNFNSTGTGQGTLTPKR